MNPVVYDGGMTDVLLLLAEAAATADGLPGWAKNRLGPLGALVLLGVYAYYTEKKRIPAVVEQIKKAQMDLTTLRDDHKVETNELRTKHEADEDKLRDDIQEWRDRHTKERGARAWWQSKAEGLAKQLDIEVGIPPDIDKTHYQSDEG